MREQIIQAVLEEKIIAIVRGADPEQCLKVAQALYDGGIRMMEITYNQKDPASWQTTADTIAAIAKEFAGRMLVGAGTVTTPELVDLAVRMMRLMAIGYVCISVTQVLGGVMRGAGDTVTPMWISIISTILLRVPCAYLLAYLTRSAEYPNGQPQALFGSLMISWTLGMIISAVVFRMGHWRKKMIESMKSYQMRE